MGSFVEEHRIPNFDFRAIKGLIMGQETAELAVSNFFEGRFLGHHSQFPLLYKLPRDRGILGKKQIVISIILPIAVGGVGSKN